jgi:hypothetical protein
MSALRRSVTASMDPVPDLREQSTQTLESPVMNAVLYVSGAIVFTFGLIWILISTPSHVREKAAVEALKRGDYDRAVKAMLDL